MPDEQINAHNVSQAKEIEQLRLQLASQQLELQQLKASKSSINYWTSPITIAVITGALAVFSAGLANFMQSRANVALERQKFESAAFLKALDTQDTDKAAKLLVFMVKAKLLSDPSGKLAALEYHPEQLPPSSHSAADESRLARLDPKVADMARALITKARQSGIDVLVVTGYRSPEEQNLLYARGRTAPGPMVTMARAGYSTHNCGLAFDVAIVDPTGSIVWNGTNPQLKQLADIGREVGLAWGGDSKFPETNHFEQPNAHCNPDGSEATTSK